MREFSKTQISEIERKIREMAGVASSVFTSLTGTNITGSNLLYTSGTFGEISATVGKFHILSASYNNLVAGSLSGTLLTYSIGIFDVLTGTTITGSTLLSTSVIAQNITASVGITGSNSFFTSGTIQNLAVLSGTFGTGTFNEISSTIGKYHLFSASNGLIIVATGTTLTYTNATIQNTTGLNGIFTNLTGTNLTGSSLLFTSGTIQNLFTLSATINTASFNEISATIGRFHIFSASFALTTNITGTTLNFTNGNIQTLTGLSANYTNLTGTNLTGSNSFFTSGTIQNLSVLSATINTGTFSQLSSTIGKFHIFSASFGLIGTVTGTTLNYTNGNIQTLTGLSVNYTNITGTSITGSGLFFTSGTIQNLSVLSATINTGTFNELSSTVGRFHIASASFGLIGTFTGSSLLFTSGTIQNLSVLSATINTGTFNQLSSTILRSHIFSASFGLIGTITGSALNYTNGNIQTLTGLSANYTNLTGTNLTGSNSFFTSGTIQNLSVLSATINTGTFNELSSTVLRSHIFSASFGLIGTVTGSTLNYTNGNIQTLTGLSANYTNLTGTYITGSSILLTSAQIQKITASIEITGSGLFFTSGTIQNLSVLSATINTGTFNELSSTILRSHIFSSSFGLIGTITGTTLNYTNGNIQTLTGLSANYTNLTGTNLTGSNSFFTSGTIQNLSVLSATINTGTFNQLSSTVGRFHIFSASFGLIGTVTGSTLSYTNGNIQTLAGLSANYTNITGTYITGSSLLFTSGTIQNLSVLSATINTGTFNQLSSTILRSHLFSSSFGLIGNITGSTLNYTNGNIQTLTGLSANFTNLTGTNLTGSNSFFTSGTIQNLSVLSATINTGTFNQLSSTIGKFYILSASFGLIGTVTGTTLNYTNGNIQTLTGLSANYTNLTGTNLTGSNSFFTSGTIQNLSVLSATINTGTFNQLSSTVGRFHIISASFGLSVGSGTSSGALADYTTGIFTYLTGTNTTGTNLWFQNTYLGDTRISNNIYAGPSNFAISGSSTYIYTLLLSGSNLYIGGSFTSVGHVSGDSTYTATLRNNFSAINKDSQIINQFNPNVNNNVYSTILSDSNLYIAGDFTTVSGTTRNHLAAINKDSGVLGPFNPDVDGVVYSVIESGDNIYIGGIFTEISGSSRFCLGSVDKNSGAVNPFDPNPDGWIYSMLVSGSNLYIGGAFSTVSGTTRNRIAVVDKDSGALGPFNPNIAGSVYSMILSGSNLYIAGGITTVSGTTRNRIAVVDKDSGALGPFNPNITGTLVYNLALSGSNLYIAGNYTYVSGTARNHISVVDKDSGALGPFNPNITGTAAISIAISNSNLYIGGLFTTVSGTARDGFAVVDKDSGALINNNIVSGSNFNFITGDVQRLNVSSGIFDFAQIYSSIITSSYVEVPYLYSGTIPVELTGTMSASYIYDSFESTLGNWINDSSNNQNHNANWIRLSGSTPTALTGPQSASADLWYIYPEYSSSISYSITGTALIRNSTVQSTFGCNTPATLAIYGILTSSNTLYLVGNFTSLSGTARNLIGSCDKFTGVLNPFNPNISAGTLASTFLISGSNLYIGGLFSTVSGSTRNNLAVVDKDSGALGPFNPNVNGTVDCLLLSGNNLYLGGAFTQVSGTTRNRLAAVHKDTGALIPFNPSVSTAASYVFTMEISGSNLYIGGSFTTVSGSTRNGVAVVNKDSGALGVFNPNVTILGNTVRDLLISGSNLYIGGRFTTVSGSTRNGIAVVDKDSGALGPFNPNVTNTGTIGVMSMAISGSYLYVGGGFSTVSGSTRNNFAVVNKDSGALDTFDLNLDNMIEADQGIIVDHIQPSGTYGGSYVWISGMFTKLSGSNSSMLTTSASITLTSSYTGTVLTYDPYIYFDMHSYGSDIHDVVLEIEDQSTTGTWYPLWSRHNQLQTASNEPWQTISASMSAYINKSVKLRFWYTRFGNVSDLSFDKINIAYTSSYIYTGTQPSILTSSGTITSNFGGAAIKFPFITGTYGFFGELSSTIGRFHILSATNHNIAGSSSGSLATYSIGVFDVLTGTTITGSSGLFTSITSQNMTASVGITGSSALFTNGTIQTVGGLSANYTNLTGTYITGSTISGTSITVQSSSIYNKGAGTTIVCGNDITSLVRSSQVGITGTTLTDVLTITAVPLGRYRLNAMVIWQADATTTGLDVAVDFGGTTTKWYMEHRFATTGGTAATAAASGNATAGTGNLYEAQGKRTKGAVIGSGSVSTDAVNSDTMSIIEGFFVVSVAGDLKIKAAAEAASLAVRVQEGTNILLYKLD